MNKSKNPSPRVPTPRATTPRATTPRVPTPRTPTSRQHTGIVFSETTDDNQEPSNEDVEEQARRLGVDVEKEPHLVELVVESLLSQVPLPWKPCFDATKKAWYYYNQDTYKSQWEHPADPIYRDKIKKLREEVAMNLMQNTDTRTAKPLKSLPPLKKPSRVMSLDPMPQLKELKKLGPIPKTMTAPMESAFNRGLSSLSLNPTAFKSLGQPIDSMNLKDEDESSESETRPHTTPSDDSRLKGPSSNVITAAPKKSGLKLTGAGSTFIKRDFSKSEEDMESPIDVKPQIVPNPIPAKENGKPFKSILVNSSMSSIRSQNQSTNKKWNVDLDSLKDDEQSVWNQFHSNETRAPTVKFKLDEDTELHFETSLNENLENVSGDSKETTDQESDEEDEESENDDDTETDGSQSPVSMKREGSASSKNSATSNQIVPKPISSSASSSAGTPQSKPDSSQSEKAAPNKMVEKENSASVTLVPKNERKVNVNQSRTEQPQGKTLEEIIDDLNKEREEAVKRTQEQLEKQKSQDIMKAREEIENILKLEMDKIKADFQIKIQTKRAELLHQHNKDLNDSIEMLKKQQEQQILQLKTSHTATLEKMKAEAAKEFELEKATVREEIRKTFEEDKEKLKRKLIKENEFELNKIKFELEQQKVILEMELKTSIENIEKGITSTLESAKSKEAEQHARALEMKEKELADLRDKYERLEKKYDILKKQIQFLVENERGKSEKVISQSDHFYRRRSARSRRAPKDKKPFTDADFIVSDNEDSANESEHDVGTSSASIDQQKSSDEDQFQEPPVEDEIQTRDVRLKSALKSIEDIRQQIIALTKEDVAEKSLSTPVDSRKLNSKIQKINRVRSRQGPDPESHSSKDQESQYSEQHNDHKETQQPNKDLVEEAKDFIRSQRHRLNKPNDASFVTPIATTLGVKQRLALEMKKAQDSGIPKSLKSKSKNIPPFLHLDHRSEIIGSETESSGVGSWKDMQSMQKRKVSEEIDHICQSLSALDGEMKQIWSLFRGGSGKNFLGQSSTFPSGNFTKSLAEELSESTYRQQQPIAVPAQFALSERQSLPGTIDQLKQRWTANVKDENNQGDTFGVSHGMAYDNHISNYLNPTRPIPYDIPADNGLLSTINPTNVLQFKHLAFDNTLRNFIPVRGNTSFLVETLDEEIKQFREKQQQLVDEFAPQRDITTTDGLHERTKHLREWLDKF